MKDYKIKVERKDKSFVSYVLKHDEVVFCSENNPTSIVASRKAGDYIANINNTISFAPIKAPSEPLPTTQPTPIITPAKPINLNQISFPRKCCGRG